MRILAGDIGGTNTRLSTWHRDEASGALREVGTQAKFKNANFPSLDAILAQYQPPADAGSGGAGPITDACFGIAGPVDGRSVRLTNIPHWPEVRADDIARRFDIAESHRVSLINDMAAHGSSLAHIEAHHADHVTQILPGRPQATGLRAIVAPGTGLGTGMLTWDARAGLHRPLPSEAGHEDVPARDDATAALIVSMRKLFPGQNVTRERVVSGPGLRAIYACLTNPALPDLAVAPKAEDLLGLSANDAVAQRTLETFTRLLGELAACFTLSTLAVGGVYLTGNIATTLHALLQTGSFGAAFRSSGPPSMRDLIASVPVKVVTYEETGLLGAAIYATWAGEKRV